MLKGLEGFKAFLLRGNVVDLAVAVVVGAAFGALVASFVADLLTPLIAAIAGKPDFSALAFTIHHSTFRYGRFVNAVVSFVVVATAVYFVVVLPLGKLAERRKRGAPPEAAKQPEEKKPEEVQLLAQIRDLLERRQAPLPR